MVTHTHIQTKILLHLYKKYLHSAIYFYSVIYFHFPNILQFYRGGITELCVTVCVMDILKLVDTIVF